MCEALLAILLVCSSGKGSNLAFHWPPFPTTTPRLTRPRPALDAACSPLDIFFLAAQKSEPQSTDLSSGAFPLKEDPEEDGWAYEWKRPSGQRHRSPSFARSSRSRPGSGRTSPSKGAFHDSDTRALSIDREYDSILGYSTEFLANTLCPPPTRCHQKFELIVDDLAFIGHPVSAEFDGVWRFKPEKVANRGRRAEKLDSDDLEQTVDINDQAASQSSLQTFHLVLVMDLPDPSSSASGNVYKYFHVIYEQIVFVVTAVLYQEQVLQRFMENECDTLNTLKESCISRGDRLSDYMKMALEVSSVARSVKMLHESIRANAIATLSINSVSFELQLPPYLDYLLHPEEDISDVFVHDDDNAVSWGTDLSFGWRLPFLAPWKSLLLMHSDAERGDLFNNMRNPDLCPEDQELAEGLILFLQSASVFTSLSEMANDLSWDLESQVYPTVRWLVAHRRAKIVDMVHEGLKTVFVLPPKLEPSLAELSSDFTKDFSQQDMPSLPEIFSSMSSSSSLQSGRADTDKHFFATVVHTKDRLPLYRGIVIWLLKRDLLITLHLRVRIVATTDLRYRARKVRNKAPTSPHLNKHMTMHNGSEIGRVKENDKDASKRPGKSYAGRRSSVASALQIDDEDDTYPASMPSIVYAKAQSRGRRFSSTSVHNDLAKSVVREERNKAEPEKGIQFENSEGSDEEEEKDVAEEGNLQPSIIRNPGRPTSLQRKWLELMSEDKDPELARRFQQINQYFDGKRTADEIMYRADIRRKELRKVLDHYQEYVRKPIITLQDIY